MLCKGSRLNQLWLGFERKVGQIVKLKMESKFVTFFLYVFVVKMTLVQSQSQTTVSFWRYVDRYQYLSNLNL